MNLADLKKELAEPQYAKLSAEEAAALINGKTVPVRTLVPSQLIRKTLLLRGLWGPLRKAAVNVGSNADIVLEALNAFETFDFADLQIAGMIDAMIASFIKDGLFTVEDGEALKALSFQFISRAEQLGWQEIHVGDVETSAIVDDDGQVPGHAERLAAADERDRAWFRATESVDGLVYEDWRGTPLAYDWIRAYNDDPTLNYATWFISTGRK